MMSVFFLNATVFSFPSSRIKLSSFWEEKEEEKKYKKKRPLMKWPTVPGSWTSSLLPPVVDFTYKKIETGKTLFSLQFI